ncbi:hypothetical protein GCM10017771_11240 [Streptomyces capitiformicae]|uniref:Uncharacterized protein n=1 Tax=Streptomyces capitiformicae TaxID=2014920 RepID=A0A919GGT5_9ACTN|nr:hypothetical protein GCM10017771_11240 [Streptomyces capitiformicae]
MAAGADHLTAVSRALTDRHRLGKEKRGVGLLLEAPAPPADSRHDRDAGAGE